MRRKFSLDKFTVRSLPAMAMHGDKQQAERDWVLKEFKEGRSPILVATDVASRGLDVKDVMVGDIRSLPSLHLD